MREKGKKQLRGVEVAVHLVLIDQPLPIGGKLDIEELVKEKGRKQLRGVEVAVHLVLIDQPLPPFLTHTNGCCISTSALNPPKPNY